VGEAIDKHVGEHGTTSDGYLFQGRKKPPEAPPALPGRMASRRRGLLDLVGDVADAGQVEFEDIAVAEPPADSAPMLSSSPGISCSLADAWPSRSNVPADISTAWLRAR
jgi:hypothetical protein